MGTLLPNHWSLILEQADPVPSVYVETGLWKGNQLAIAAKLFAECHGIELAPHWAEHNRSRFADDTHVLIHEGDSAVVLPRVLDTIDDAAVILLDAHFCKTDPPVAKSKFPLWAELDRISARATPDIVIVDDVHTFARRREDLRYQRGDVEWEAVTPAEIVDRLGRVAAHRKVGDSYVVWRQPGF